ncbi:MAG: hypothetical protein ABII22_04570 [Candidatus Micrarchaeota archaeon]
MCIRPDYEAEEQEFDEKLLLLYRSFVKCNEEFLDSRDMQAWKQEDRITDFSGHAKSRLLELLKGGEHMVTMLPIVEEDGKEWFFDERLRQLRNVETPHDYRDLDTVELLYYKGKAVHRMPTKRPKFPS